MSIIINGFNTGAPKIVGLQVENGTTVTGTTSATKSATITIPANTLQTNSILEVVWSTVRSGGSSNVIQGQVYVNTSDTLTGATQIALGANMSSAQQNVKGGRDIQKLNTSCQIMQVTQFASDYSITSGAPATFTLNNSNTIYFLFACLNLSAADSSYINRIRITEYAP
jgi:hypothetical protein